jgi:hypothetical protein
MSSKAFAVRTNVAVFEQVRAIADKAIQVYELLDT